MSARIRSAFIWSVVSLLSVTVVPCEGETINLPVPFKPQYPPGTIRTVTKKLPSGEIDTHTYWNSHNCGPASLLMVIASATTGQAPTEQDIKDADDWLAANVKDYQLNSYNGSDISADTLLRLAKEKYGYVGSFISRTWSFGDLLSELKAAHPIVVGVRTDMGTVQPSTGHFMVLKGVINAVNNAYADTDKICVNDPGHSAGEDYCNYTIGDFKAAWKTQNNVAFVLSAALAPAPRVSSIQPSSIVGSNFSLTINGAGFDASSVDQIFSQNPDRSLNFIGQGTGIHRSADGKQIVVTEHMAGAAPLLQPYIVKVMNSDGQLSNAVSLVLNDEVSVSPASAPPGTTFAYGGRGFTANFGVTSHLRRPDGTEFNTQQIPTSSDGTFNQIIDGTGFAAGQYEVWAIDNNTGKATPHAMFAVTVSTPTNLVLYDDFSGPTIDPTRWSPSTAVTTPALVRAIQNGELVLTNAAPLSNVLENAVLMTQLMTLRTLQANIRLTDWEAPPLGAVNTNSARLLFTLYNDGTSGGGVAGDIVANFDFGAVPGSPEVVINYQIFRCGDPSCTQSSALHGTFGVVSDPTVFHQLAIAWDGASTVKFIVDGSVQSLNPLQLGAVATLPRNGYTGLSVVGVSRIGAVFDDVFVARAQAATLSLDDNFNDNSVNNALWTQVVVPAGGATVTETNQRVEMVILAANNQYAALHGKCRVHGDFDVQVDFALLNWPAQNFHTVRLAADSLPQGPIGLDGVYRNSYNDENYQFRSIDGLVVNISRNDIAGTLRLRRVGTMIQGYFWDGSQFVLLGSSPTTTDDTGFVIDFSGGSGAPVTPLAGMAIAFDNFRATFDSVAGCQP